MAYQSVIWVYSWPLFFLADILQIQSINSYTSLPLREFATFHWIVISNRQWTTIIAGNDKLSHMPRLLRAVACVQDVQHRIEKWCRCVMVIDNLHQTLFKENFFIVVIACCNCLQCCWKLKEWWKKMQCRRWVIILYFSEGYNSGSFGMKRQYTVVQHHLLLYNGQAAVLSVNVDKRVPRESTHPYIG